MKESKAEKDLWKVNDTKSDKVFVKRLAGWVFKYYGNVNVGQRLNIISIKSK